MTTEQSGENAAELWKQPAERFKALALEKIDNGMPDLAIKFALCAEACWWQATGEGDVINAKHAYPVVTHKRWGGY